MSNEPTPVSREDTPPAPRLVECPTCGTLTVVRSSLCVRCGRDNPAGHPVRIRSRNDRVGHVHDRSWRPCPATMPPPLRPSKLISSWFFEFAEAIAFEDTFEAFVAQHPDDFPGLAS